MKPVRILHFRREVPTGGGPESLIVDISRHLDRSRFELRVAVFGSDAPDYSSPLIKALKETGTDVTVIPARHKLDPAPIRRLSALLNERRIDILHSHDHRSNLIAYLAARSRPTVQVATLHQPLRRYWWIRHWEVLDEWVWRHFDRILPVAEYIRGEVVRKHPRIAGRVTTILNGVDLSRFHPNGRREQVRSEFNIPPEAVLCVTIGRFLPDKGLQYLLRAARQVLDRRKDVYWLLAGRGPLEQEMHELAHSLKLGDNVIFAGFRTDVVDLLAAADLMVVSSTCEGCSVAILEAMACGRAVVATRVGGTPEIVEHGQTGLIVEPRRPDQLAEAVQSLADDPSRRGRMGREGLERSRRFTVERMVRRFEEVYEELMASRTAPPCPATGAGSR